MATRRLGTASVAVSSWTLPSASAPLSPWWAAFPSWPASTSTWPGEIVLLRAPTGPARPACCGPAPGCCRSSSGEAEVLGHDLTRDRRAVRRRVGLLGHATVPVRRPDRRGQRALRGPGRGRPTRRGRRRAGPPGPRRPAARRTRRPRCRPGSAGGRRWPSWWPAARAVVARRAPRRPGRRAPGPARRAGPRRRRPAGATVRAGLPRARPGRGSGRGGHRRRGRGRYAPVPRHRWPPAATARPRSPAGDRRSPSMWRDAALVAGKDLRIELRIAG